MNYNRIKFMSFFSLSLIISYKAQEEELFAQSDDLDDLSKFKPDGPKIGFMCKKVQTPLIRRRKVILETTVVIKKKVTIITGETAFELVCTMDSQFDEPYVKGKNKKETDTNYPDYFVETEDQVKTTTQQEYYPEEEIIDPDAEEPDNEEQLTSYYESQEQYIKEQDQSKSSIKQVCEDSTFCVDENGNIIINGVSMNEEPVNGNGNKSRFDVTKPIRGAKYGFICKQILTPILRMRSYEQGANMEFICQRDKSKDSGSINPRLNSKKKPG